MLNNIPIFFCQIHLSQHLCRKHLTIYFRYFSHWMNSIQNSCIAIIGVCLNQFYFLTICLEYDVCPLFVLKLVFVSPVFLTKSKCQVGVAIISQLHRFNDVCLYWHTRIVYWIIISEYFFENTVSRSDATHLLFILKPVSRNL